MGDALGAGAGGAKAAGSGADFGAGASDVTGLGGAGFDAGGGSPFSSAFDPTMMGGGDTGPFGMSDPTGSLGAQMAMTGSPWGDTSGITGAPSSPAGDIGGTQSGDSSGSTSPGMNAMAQVQPDTFNQRFNAGFLDQQNAPTTPPDPQAFSPAGDPNAPAGPTAAQPANAATFDQKFTGATPDTFDQRFNVSPEMTQGQMTGSIGPTVNGQPGTSAWGQTGAVFPQGPTEGAPSVGAGGGIGGTYGGLGLPAGTPQGDFPPDQAPAAPATPPAAPSSQGFPGYTGDPLASGGGTPAPTPDASQSPTTGAGAGVGGMDSGMPGSLQRIVSDFLSMILGRGNPQAISAFMRDITGMIGGGQIPGQNYYNPPLYGAGTQSGAGAEAPNAPSAPSAPAGQSQAPGQDNQPGTTPQQYADWYNAQKAAGADMSRFPTPEQWASQNGGNGGAAPSPDSQGGDGNGGQPTAGGGTPNLPAPAQPDPNSTDPAERQWWRRTNPPGLTTNQRQTLSGGQDGQPRPDARAAARGISNTIPQRVLAGARQAALQGGPGAVAHWMAQNGHPQWGNWCGEFTAAVMQSQGLPVPQHPEIASNWRNWGSPTHNPQPGDIAVRRGPRTGQTGSHVVTVQRVNPDGTMDVVGGNQGRIQKTIPQRGYDFRTMRGGQPQSSLQPGGGRQYETAAEDSDQTGFVPGGVDPMERYGTPAAQDVMVNPAIEGDVAQGTGDTDLDSSYRRVRNDMNTLSNAQFEQKYGGQTKKMAEGFIQNYRDVVEGGYGINAIANAFSGNTNWDKFQQEARPSTNIEDERLGLGM